MAIKVKDAEDAYRKKGRILPHSNPSRLGVQTPCLAEINYALYRDPLVPSDAIVGEKEIGEDDQDEQDERRKASAKRKGLR
jgi:hypothetical protein